MIIGKGIKEAILFKKKAICLENWDELLSKFFEKERFNHKSWLDYFINNKKVKLKMKNLIYFGSKEIVIVG